MEDLLATSFGTVLRRLRRQKELTQEVLGTRSNVQQKHISALETGSKQPSIGTIFRIADALDVAPGHLIALVDAERQILMASLSRIGPNP